MPPKAAPAQPAPPARARRPRGVTVLAGVLLFVGALLAPLGFIVAARELPAGNFLGALLAVLTPQALIVGALGLLFLKRWGVYVTVVVLLLLSFQATRELLLNPVPPAAARAAIVLGVTFAALYYLTREHVKRAFGAPVVAAE